MDTRQHTGASGAEVVADAAAEAAEQARLIAVAAATARRQEEERRRATTGTAGGGAVDIVGSAGDHPTGGTNIDPHIGAAGGGAAGDLGDSDADIFASDSIERAENVVKTAENAEVGIMFAIGQSAWTTLISTVAWPFLFIFNAFQTVLAWREAFLERQRSGSVRGIQGLTLAKVAASTASTVLLGLAIVGAFFATLGSALVAPALFCAAYAVKALYHIGKALYHGAMLLRRFFAVNTNRATAGSAEYAISGHETAQGAADYDGALAAHHRAQLKQELVLAGTSTLVAVALGIMFFLTKASMGISIGLGMVGAAIATVFYGTKASEGLVSIRNPFARKVDGSSLKEPVNSGNDRGHSYDPMLSAPGAGSVANAAAPDAPAASAHGSDQKLPDTATPPPIMRPTPAPLNAAPAGGSTADIASSLGMPSVPPVQQQIIVPAPRQQQQIIPAPVSQRPQAADNDAPPPAASQQRMAAH